MRPSEQWRKFADALEARGNQLHQLHKENGSGVLAAASLALGGAALDATVIAAELALDETVGAMAAILSAAKGSP